MRCIGSSEQKGTNSILVMREDTEDENELHNPPIEKPGDYRKYTDSGVKRDIRKRDRTLSPQSDVSTHDLYRQVQSGGDIPTSGLQFPIPKRKDTNLDPYQQDTSSQRPHSHQIDSHHTESHCTDSHHTESHCIDSHHTDSHCTVTHHRDYHRTDYHRSDSRTDFSYHHRETSDKTSHYLTHRAVKEYLSDQLTAKILDKIYQASGPYSSYLDVLAGSRSRGSLCARELNCSKCSLSDTCEKITKDCLSFPSPTPSQSLDISLDNRSQQLQRSQTPTVDIPRVSPLLKTLTEEYYREKFPNHVEKYFEDSFSDIDSASLVCHDPAHCSGDSDNCDTQLFLDDILFDGYPYDLYPHLRTEKLLNGDNDMIHAEQTNRSLAKSPASVPVRKPNAKKFSFTKACLAELFSEEQSIMDKRLRFQTSETESESDSDAPERPPVPSDQPRGGDFPGPEEATLEEEMKRPEVQALMRKYNPGPAPLKVQIDAEEYHDPDFHDPDLRDPDFRDPDLRDPEDERNRQEYRQKVSEHYRRLLEEQVLTPDAEYLNRSWSSSLDGSLQRGADDESPGYKVGIDESDWREIDHQRSRSLERSSSREHLNRSCNSLTASLERPLGLVEEPKKSKKVRIQTQEALVKSDSAPDLQYEEVIAQDPEDLQTSDISLSVYEGQEEEVEEMDTDEQVEYNRQIEAQAARKEFLQPTQLATRPPRPKSAHERSSKHHTNSSPMNRSSSSPTHRSSRIANHSPVSDSGFRRGGTLEEYYHNLGSESSDRSSRLDPHTYQSYAAGILHSSRKSEKFLDLQKHYATMERIAEIEEQTLESNMEKGKPAVNIMNPQARSLGALAPQSKADALLLSKYKLENLWELKELYADLDEAQEDGEFFYDTKNLDRIQWNPWKDIGLNIKELSIQDLQDLYESGRNANTKARRKYQQDPREFKRQMSFGKLRAKYMHLDEETQKQKLLDDWLHSRYRSRRNSDASSSTCMSNASMAGSYIEIMENASKKAKERPLYGYYIDESPNRYDKHIGIVSALTKSCPDITVQGRKRSRSTDSSLRASPSHKQDFYRVKESPKQSPEKQPSKTRASPQGPIVSKSSLQPPRPPRHEPDTSPKDDKHQPWKKHNNTLSPTTKSSESGYDSLDSRAQRQLGMKLSPELRTTPPQRKQSPSPRLSSGSDSSERKKKGKFEKPVKRRGSMERHDSSDSIDGKVVPKRGKSRGKPKWQPGEIRGVMGLPADARSDSPISVSSVGTNDMEPRQRGRSIGSNESVRDQKYPPMHEDKRKENLILKKADPVPQVTRSRSAVPFSKYQDQNSNEKRFNDDAALAKRKTDLNHRILRKDSKPDPGSVSQAISMFKSLENFDQPPAKNKSTSLRSRSYDILEEAEKPYVVKSAFSGYTPPPKASNEASPQPLPPRRSLPPEPKTAATFSPKPSKHSPRSSLSLDRHDKKRMPKSLLNQKTGSPQYSNVKTSTPVSIEKQRDMLDRRTQTSALTSPQPRSNERSRPVERSLLPGDKQTRSYEKSKVDPRSRTSDLDKESQRSRPVAVNSLKTPYKYRSKSSEALHEMAYDFISNPDPFKPNPVNQKEINTAAFLDAKSKFETASTEDLRYPQTGLTSKSTKTALGRYEAKIRSRSMGHVSGPQPPPEVLYAETEQPPPSHLQRHSEYSKSTPNLWGEPEPSEGEPDVADTRSRSYRDAQRKVARDLQNNEAPGRNMQDQYKQNRLRDLEVPRRDVKDRYQPVYKGRSLSPRHEPIRGHSPYESQSLEREMPSKSDNRYLDTANKDTRPKRTLPSLPPQRNNDNRSRDTGNNYPNRHPDNAPKRSDNEANEAMSRSGSANKPSAPTNYQTIHEVLSSNLAIQRPHSFGSGQYDYISVTTTRSEDGKRDEEDEFTFKYNPATGKISPITEQQKTDMVSSSPDARIRPGEDTRFEKVFGMKIPPGPGESGIIHVNYYQKKPVHRLVTDSGSVTSASEMSPRSDSTASTVRQRPRSAREMSANKTSSPEKPSVYGRYQSNYGEGHFHSKSNEAFSKAVASIEPMVKTFNRDEWDGAGSYDNETGEMREQEYRRKPALTNSGRSASTTAMQVDDEYGNLNKWSRMNVADGLNRPVSADNLNNVDQWNASNLTRTSSVTTGSADTLIIKGSDPDLTSPDINEASPRTFSSVKQLKSHHEGVRSFEKSQSEPNLNLDVPKLERSRSAVSQEDVQDDEDAMKCANFNQLREHYEAKAKLDKDNIAKASTLPTRSYNKTNDRNGEPANSGIQTTRNWTSNGEGPKGRAWKREREVLPDQKDNTTKPSQSPQRYWDIYRNEAREPGPKEFIENIELLGNEWEREKQKQAAHNYDSRPPNYKIGTVQPQPRETIPKPPEPPGYKAPPQYENPIPPSYQLNNLRNGPSASPSNFTYDGSPEKVPKEWYMPQQKLNSDSPSTVAGSPAHQRPNSLNLGQGQGYTQANLPRSRSLSTTARPTILGHHSNVDPNNDKADADAKRKSDSAESPFIQYAREPSQQQQPQPQSSPARSHVDPRSPANTLDRRRRDEEAARRKAEMQQYFEEQRHKKIEKEMRDNEARRHADVFLDNSYWMELAGITDNKPAASQKSPITPDRFEEFSGVEAAGVQRPNTKVKNTVVRGKAKALYTFTAQNPKELSVRRHDVMYLLRDVDRHWYECEHHGRLGLVPKSYVQVLTSLDDARTAAIQRQGLATAKYTFRAQTKPELSMNKGDTIQLIRRVDEHWLEGRRGDKQGIFPASYVEILREPDTPLANTPAPSSFATTPVPGSPGQLSPGSTISNGPAPTIPSAPISPRTDYSTHSLSRMDLGRDLGRDMATPSPAPSLLSGSNTLQRSNGYHTAGGGSGAMNGGGRSTSPYPRDDARDAYTRKYEQRINASSKPDDALYPPYRAVYAYTARAPDELSLREGDVVYVMERCDDGWYVGTSHRTHEFGTFPGNYVQRC